MCQQFFGYPNVMKQHYLNSGFFIFHSRMRSEFVAKLSDLHKHKKLDYHFGYWDQLIINRFLGEDIFLPFSDCNFKPTPQSLSQHRIIHYSGPYWKPWKVSDVTAPFEKYRYLFQIWWKYEEDFERDLNMDYPKNFHRTIFDGEKDDL